MGPRSPTLGMVSRAYFGVDIFPPFAEEPKRLAFLSSGALRDTSLIMSQPFATWNDHRGPPDDAPMSYQRIQEKLARGETVLLDGGIGTEILRRGVYWRCHGIEQHPEIVREVHLDYLRAGADVIKTDTFQLNRRAYLNLFHGLEHMRRIGPPGLEDKAAELTRQAVELARAARRA